MTKPDTQLRGESGGFGEQNRPSDPGKIIDLPDAFSGGRQLGGGAPAERGKLMVLVVEGCIVQEG